MSLRDKLLIPKESPEKRLSSGISSVSLREPELGQIQGGWILEQVVGNWNRSQISEKLLIPVESPGKGLSTGIGNFSLRDTGAEIFRVKGCKIRRKIKQIGLGGRILEQSST